MLIYSEQRLVPTDVNMMVLSAKDGEGYFYVHRALYDQAVIIDDIYKDEHEMLIQAITGKQDTRDDVEYFFENVPRPINILGAFLLLVKEELTELIDMVGAIHVMSGPLNLRQMLKYPADMRNTPTFSLSIKEEYELAWDRFFKTTMPYGTQYYAEQPTGYTPMNGTQTTTIPDDSEEELSNIGADGNEYADPLEALLFAPPADIFDFSLDDEEKEDEKVTDVTTPAPVAPAPEPEPAPAYEEPKKDGLALLRSGLK